MSFVAVAIGVGVIGGGILASAMTSSPSLPQPPQVTPVTPMPAPDDAAINAAKAKSVSEQRRRRGRMSTILSDTALTDQPLGGT